MQLVGSKKYIEMLLRLRKFESFFALRDVAVSGADLQVGLSRKANARNVNMQTLVDNCLKRNADERATASEVRNVFKNALLFFLF